MPGGHRGRRAIVAVIARAALADRPTYGTLVALARAARSLRAFQRPGDVADLLGNASCRAHVATTAPADRLFFLAHDSYLARGLSADQRIDGALTHYRHETSAFLPSYGDEVHGGRGLALWSATVEGVAYGIRLQPGNDVLYEGGASAVFFVDGQRTAVVSYSRVDGAALGHTAGPRLFITRKQLSEDHGYQRAFNAAFDRTTPGHLLLAAVTGVAAALGDASIAAIRPEVHPSYEARYAAQFDTAYAAFWRSLGGTGTGDIAFELAVPMTMTPLDELSAKARKRALLRRRHLDAVHAAAAAVIRRQLVHTPAASSIRAPSAMVAEPASSPAPDTPAASDRSPTGPDHAAVPGAGFDTESVG